jgi:ABC-2 type transport system permease protein
VAIGLTLLVTWVAVGALAVGIGSALGLTWLRDLRTDVPTLLLMLLVLVPAFVLVAAFMAAIGATVTEAQEGQQMTGIIVLPFMIPVYLIVPLMEYPHSLFSIGLTLFPITAPLTIVVRSTFTVVPLWQYAAASAILIACAAGAIWLAGRAFRLGMLRYGQRIDLRELLGRAPRGQALQAAEARHE